MALLPVIITMLGALIPGEAVLPPPSMPGGLLCAPVNLSWAADHAGYWQEKGFGGFLVQGVFHLMDTDMDAVAADAPLVGEIRSANQRLKEQGISENFLYVEMAPEEAWFTTPELTQRLMASFGAAGDFCREAGLRGLALDTRSSSVIYDWQWDGYDLDSQPQETVRSAVRAFGRRAFRAVIGAHPETALIIIADDLPHAGPLWFDLFDGLVESVGAADSIPLHLLVRAGCQETRPDALRALARQTQGLAMLQLRDDSQAIWRRQGAVGLGMTPFSYEGESPVSYCSSESFRVQALAAKAYSHTYAWVDAPLGGWWRVTADDMTKYLGLRQGYPAGVVETLPLLPDADQYRVSGPLDGLTRLDNVPFPALDGREGMVFQDGTQAAVVFWDGADIAAAMNALQATSAVNLKNGAAYVQGGMEDVNASGLDAPLLFRGIPAAPLLLQAGLWMRPDEAFSAGRSRMGLSFGLTNRTERAINGNLELVAPTGYGIGSGRFRVNADPGETVSFRRTVQGIFQSGEFLEFRLLLTSPGMKAVAGCFQYTVAPEMQWAARLDGVPPGSPALIPRTASQAEFAITADQSGEVVCWDKSGAPVWRHRFRAAFYAPPLAGRGPGGVPMTGLIDHRGIVRFLDMQGAASHVLALGAPCFGGQALLADLLEQEYDVLLAALDDGRLVCLPMGMEQPLWEHAFAGKVAGIYHASMTGGGPLLEADTAWSAIQQFTFVVSGHPEPAAWCLDATGTLRWKMSLPAQPVGPMAMALLGAGQWTLLIPALSGQIHCLEAFSGALRHTLSTGRKAAVNDVMAVHESADSAPEIIFTDAHGVHRCTEQGETQWHVPFSGARRISPVTLAGESAVIVTSDNGALCALTLSGVMIWQDGRAVAGVAGPAVIADMDGDYRMECLYLSADRMLRAIDIGAAVPLRPLK